MSNNKFIISEFYSLDSDINLLKEAIEQGKPVMLSGILQKANTLNRNGRVYPYDILKREVAKYMELVENDLATGELNHPDSAIIDLGRVSHKVTEMWWQGEDVYGNLQIAETPIGDIVKGLLKTGIKLGISSRGVGSVKSIKGQDVVQEDFELIAFDIVSTPSTPGAYLFQESKQWGLTPITEEKWNQIKCENGICRVVNKKNENNSTIFENINSQQYQQLTELFKLKNKDFWKNN